MSCACEQKKLSEEYERMKRLAKSYACMQGETVALYMKTDGTYDFATTPDNKEIKIVEYISPY